MSSFYGILFKLLNNIRTYPQITNCVDFIKPIDIIYKKMNKKEYKHIILTTTL